jgi:hypothetical protein
MFTWEYYPIQFLSSSRGTLERGVEENDIREERSFEKISYYSCLALFGGVW